MKSMTQNECLVVFMNNKCDSYDGRIQQLIDISNGEWHMLPNKRTLQSLRRRFIISHVHNKKYPLASYCWACDYEKDSGEYFMVRHHIIPLSRGGSNRRVNIITVCSRCHATIHPWLKDTVSKWMSQEMEKRI